MEHRRNIEDQCNRGKNRKLTKKYGSTYYAEKRRHNTSQHDAFSPNSAYRERSREKPLAQSCFFNGNHSI